MKLVKNVAISAILGTATYFALYPYTYAQRGYFALGGEVMLAAAVGFVSLYMFQEKEKSA